MRFKLYEVEIQRVRYRQSRQLWDVQTPEPCFIAVHFASESVHWECPLRAPIVAIPKEEARS